MVVDEFPSTLQKSSVYILFDTNYIEYYEQLRNLSNDLDEWIGKFIPRFNYLGSACLIQIKVKKEQYPWISKLSPGILGVGDKNWAYKQTREDPEWLKKAYNPWKIHRDFCKGKVTKEEYEQLLEEGRDLLTIVGIKEEK